MRRNQFVISTKVTQSDDFLKLSKDAQYLYYRLCEYADSEGFVTNPYQIIRLYGLTPTDLNILEDAHYILTIDKKVFVIKHHNINNSIRFSRIGHEDSALRNYLFIKSDLSYTLNPDKSPNSIWYPLFYLVCNRNKINSNKSIFAQALSLIESDTQLSICNNSAKQDLGSKDYGNKLALLLCDIDNAINTFNGN